MSDVIFSILFLVLYIAEAVFFVYITFKCFFDRFSIGKSILLAVISPASGFFVAYILATLFLGDDLDGTEAIIFSVAITAFQIILQLIFIFFYVKIVKTENPSIAIFLYLCGIMLVPEITLMFSLTNSFLPIIVPVIMAVVFYFITVRPLSKITRIKQETDSRLFIILPAIVFVYHTIIMFFFMNMFNVAATTIGAASEIAPIVVDSGPEGKAYFLKMLYGMKTYFNMDSIIIFLSDAVILAVLMISFSIIVRNIIYMNETKKANEEIKELSVEVMEALAHTIDAKDKYTKGHSIRVANYSRMLAEKMGLSPKECEDVYYYGLLHDLGKIGVPNEIINSPTRLTDEEYGVIKTHPAVGSDILAEIHSRPDLTIGARWHHERYDGKGYPDGKKGEEIPLPARIIAVADSYDAMTSNRSYRDYLSQNKVREELENNKGTQFDPVIADYMIEIIDEDKDYLLHE